MQWVNKQIPNLKYYFRYYISIFYYCCKIKETAMRESLKQTLKQVITSLIRNLKTRDKWILEWPGQLCITASQVNWNK